MDDKKIIKAVGGLDVVSPETNMPDDCLRVATNIVIQKTGSFNRRDGYSLALALPGLHSLWRSKAGDLAFGVASGTLYSINNLGVTAVATGLWNLPVRYAEAGGFIYVSGGKILRVDMALNVTIPGVVSLSDFTPTVTLVNGALTPGRYGFAISGVNAAGEESGMSGVVWVDLASSSGVRVTFPGVTPSGVVAYNVYRTTPNDEVFYRAARVAGATYGTLVSGELDKLESTRLLDLLPAGTELASHRGRLYSAMGSFLYYSEPYAHGLYRRTDGFISFSSDCDYMVQPVDGGIYVATEDTVYFLSGTSPKDFSVVVAASNSVFKHSSEIIDGSHLGSLVGDDKSIGDKEVAIWLSPHGYQLGMPDGRVISAQKDKILLADIMRAPSHAFIRAGVKQIVSAVESMTLGDPDVIDSTPQ
jgi:hypothetical protein